jgi:hypothetical protein
MHPFLTRFLALLAFIGALDSVAHDKMDYAVYFAVLIVAAFAEGIHSCLVKKR